MNEQELIEFIEHIRRMCKNDSNTVRLDNALTALKQILERQHTDPALLLIVQKLGNGYASTFLGPSTPPVTSRKELEEIAHRAELRRISYESHRGCGG